jgi:hypothetical protein
MSATQVLGQKEIFSLIINVERTHEHPCCQVSLPGIPLSGCKAAVVAILAALLRQCPSLAITLGEVLRGIWPEFRKV